MNMHPTLHRDDPELPFGTSGGQPGEGSERVVSTVVVAPRRSRAVFVDGAVAGLAAGAILLLFEIGAMPLTGNPWAIPLGMMASILAGQEAMSEGFPIPTAVLAGLVAHVAISTFWGVVFAWIASGMRLRTQPRLVCAGVIFGFAVWLIDYFLVTRVAWSWFRQANSPVQFLGHTLFYGLPLGGVLGILWQRRRRVRVR
jgi:hypothetical protein